MRANMRFRVPVAIAAIGLWLAVATGTSHAQEISQEHLKIAREAVAVSQSTSRMDSILLRIGEETKQTLIANQPDAAIQIAEIVDEVTISMAPRRGQLEEEVALIYARIFSPEELQLIIDFYNSDAGQKLISETPVIARSMNQAARVWTSGVQRDVQVEVRKKIEEAGLQ